MFTRGPALWTVGLSLQQARRLNPSTVAAAAPGSALKHWAALIGELDVRLERLEAEVAGAAALELASLQQWLAGEQG